MNARRMLCSFLPLPVLPVAPREAAAAMAFDVLVRGGTVFDGRGGPPFVADVGIRGDRIVAIGALVGQEPTTVIEAGGLAVAPGFINMLSWSNESLIQDGRSQGGIRQGVTLEVLGEGTSMGPLNADMKRRLRAGQTFERYEVEGTSLAEYLRFQRRARGDEVEDHRPREGFRAASSRQRMSQMGRQSPFAARGSCRWSPVRWMCSRRKVVRACVLGNRQAR